MRNPWPSPEEAVQMPVEDLALRALDRLATTPADRLGALLTRDGFINTEVTQTEAARRRRPGIPTVTRSEEALALHPQLARAYAEAWDLCLARGWLAEEPQRPHSVFVTRLGEQRLREYRAESDVPASQRARAREHEGSSPGRGAPDQRSEAAAAPITSPPVTATMAANTFAAALDDDTSLFLFDGELLHPVDEVTFFALGGTRGTVGRLTREEFEQVRLGPALAKMFDDGTLVKGSADPIYVIEHGRKRWVPDMETLAALSKKQPYRVISDHALDRLADGPPVPSVTAKERFRSPLFGRLERIPSTVAFAADLVTVGGAVAGVVTKLAGLW
jgi:hypothetical protein